MYTLQVFWVVLKVSRTPIKQILLYYNKRILSYYYLLLQKTRKPFRIDRYVFIFINQKQL